MVKLAGEAFLRTQTLLGVEALERLSGRHVLIAGLGGVGGYAAEIVARSGVGRMTVIDADTVAESNLNRQIIALHSTLGLAKAELFTTRILDINPEIRLEAIGEFITPESAAVLLETHRPDYVIDAIDTVAPKCALLAECLRRKIPVISSMGAGGRIDPTAVGYRDLWETRDDGLAKAVRQRFKALGLRRKLLTVSSSELPRRHSLIEEPEARNKRTSFGTLAAVPAVFGILLGNKAVLDLAGIPYNPKKI